MGEAGSPVADQQLALRSWLQSLSLRQLALLQTRSPMVRPSARVITLRPAASAAVCRARRASLRSALVASGLRARSHSHWARWRPTTHWWRMDLGHSHGNSGGDRSAGQTVRAGHDLGWVVRGPLPRLCVFYSIGWRLAMPQTRYRYNPK